MKILMFNYEYPPVGGGGGVSHALLVEELARRHRIAVVTSAYRDLPRREIRRGVEILRVPVVGREERAVASLTSLVSFPPGAWLAAWRLLSRERFDLINSHFAVPTGPGSLPPALITATPHVVSLHGGDIYDPSKKISPHRVAPLRWTVSWVLRRSAAVVAQSSDTRANAYRFTSYRGPIEIIPLGIRPPEVTAAPRAELGLPEDVFLAATVGRLVKRKGVDRLLRALAHPACREVHLVIMGDGPERRSLERTAAGLELADRVRFTGAVEERRKWQILHCADAYVSATLHEGFGLAYLEAMSAGLPAVTFDHGGHVDFLRHGENGYLVPTGDERALGEALGRLAGDPAAARRLGEAARSTAEAYTVERCARAYEELFQRVMDGRAPRAVRTRAGTPG